MQAGSQALAGSLFAGLSSADLSTFEAVLDLVLTRLVKDGPIRTAAIGFSIGYGCMNSRLFRAYSNRPRAPLTSGQERSDRVRRRVMRGRCSLFAPISASRTQSGSRSE